MSVTSTSHSAAAPIQSSLSIWLEKNKAKLGKWTLITIVVAYVAFLIITPIAALAFGALEKGVGACLQSLNHPEVLIAFWNTLWISLVVVIVHSIFGTMVAWVFVRHRFPVAQLAHA